MTGRRCRWSNGWHERPMRVPKTRAETPKVEGSKRPPAYINENTHWWDGSQVYGSTPAELRDTGRPRGVHLDDRDTQGGPDTPGDAAAARGVHEELRAAVDPRLVRSFNQGGPGSGPGRPSRSRETADRRLEQDGCINDTAAGQIDHGVTVHHAPMVTFRETGQTPIEFRRKGLDLLLPTRWKLPTSRELLLESWRQVAVPGTVVLANDPSLLRRKHDTDVRLHRRLVGN